MNSPLDLASTKSIRQCAAKLSRSFTKIDILINNAGVMACPLTRTEDGFEMQLGTNHLGHFLLTNLLLPLVQSAGPGSRIITVSSMAHEFAQMQWEDLNWEKTPYSAFGAYQQSKLANVLFTVELARRLEGTGVSAYCLHPGVIGTDLGRHIIDSYGILARVGALLTWPFLKSVEAGAQTTIYCSVEETIAGHTGRYYSDCRERVLRPHASNIQDAQKLWMESETLTGL